MKLIIPILLFSSIFLCSCKVKTIVSADNSTIFPCSDLPESDDCTFYAYASAKSSNINIAKIKALDKAKALLATTILNSRNNNKTQVEIEQSVEKKNVVDCEKYEEANGRYTVYIRVKVEIK